MEDKDYIDKLEDVIKQMIRPLKGLPFSLVMEAVSGFKVLPIDLKDVKDKELIESLRKIAVLAGSAVNQKGIRRLRPNEVGNDIEEFVKTALSNNGLKAGLARTEAGKKRAAGYPDIEFVDQFGRLNYLECKTFNIENFQTSMRSFYFSPSENPKISTDAHHLVLSYEVFAAGRHNKTNIYKCAGWKLLDISELELDVKYEFNSDNNRLYNTDFVLAEGKIKL